MWVPLYEGQETRTANLAASKVIWKHLYDIKALSKY